MSEPHVRPTTSGSRVTRADLGSERSSHDSPFSLGLPLIDRSNALVSFCGDGVDEVDDKYESMFEWERRLRTSRASSSAQDSFCMASSRSIVAGVELRPAAASLLPLLCYGRA
jgi:hypothetical protein